jgi:hypothetical protein
LRHPDIEKKKKMTESEVDLEDRLRAAFEREADQINCQSSRAKPEVLKGAVRPSQCPEILEARGSFWGQKQVLVAGCLCLAVLLLR